MIRFRNPLILTLFTLTLCTMTFSRQPHSSSAAINDDPAFEALAMVPDNAKSRTELGYGNILLSQEIWGVSDMTQEEVDNKTDRAWTWVNAISATAVNIAFTSRILIANSPESPHPTMEATLGFTMFDVHQIVVYGEEPERAFLLPGNYDVESIYSAFANRDYHPTVINGIEALCPSIGCDQGIKQDFENLNNNNVFGGQLGRREPVVVQPDKVMNSASLEVLEDLIAKQTGENQLSLLDASEYQTFLEALSAQGQIVQFFVFDPNHPAWHFSDNVFTWNLNDLPTLDSSPEPEEIIAGVQSFGELPIYELFGFAQVWTGSEYLTLFLLVYDNVEDAQIASDELYRRLTTFPSVRPNPLGGPTHYDTITEYSEILPPSVYTGAEGAAALFITRVLPPSVTSENPQFDVTRTYYHFLHMYWSRDLYVIGTEFIFP